MHALVVYISTSAHISTVCGVEPSCRPDKWIQRQPIQRQSVSTVCSSPFEKDSGCPGQGPSSCVSNCEALIVLLSDDLLFKCNPDLLCHDWRGIFRQMCCAGTSSVGTDTPVSARLAFGPGRQLQLFSLDLENLSEGSRLKSFSLN